MIRGLALCVLCGCGYSFGPEAVYAHRAVQVGAADTVSERRTHEFDITQAVIRELQANGIHVNPPDAPARLEMTIADIREPALVEGPLDVVTVGSVSFRLRVRLVEIATGKALMQDEHSESASFAASRGESRDTARAQVFDRLARWVASKLEKDW